jgi:hypothetical protein
MPDDAKPATCDECSGQCPSCGFDIDGLRAEAARLAERVKELQQSMVRHFSEEHLEGDGPESERWKAKTRTAESRASRLAEALRSVEWKGWVPNEGGEFGCPRCGRTEKQGHHVACRLAAALPNAPASIADAAPSKGGGR